jgi:uncharacterized membrane protein
VVRVHFEHVGIKQGDWICFFYCVGAIEIKLFIGQILFVGGILSIIAACGHPTNPTWWDYLCTDR